MCNDRQDISDRLLKRILGFVTLCENHSAPFGRVQGQPLSNHQLFTAPFVLSVGDSFKSETTFYLVDSSSPRGIYAQLPIGLWRSVRLDLRRRLT